jgi:hypothetical protein
MMKTTIFSMLLAVLSISGSAQVLEPGYIIEKDTSKRLVISDSELKLLEMKFSQFSDVLQNSENITLKDPSNRLLISEAELEVLKTRFIPSEKINESKNDRKQIEPNPEAIHFFIKLNNREE